MTIHYVATWGGGSVKYAFRGSVLVNADLERALGRGSKMAQAMLRGFSGGGHDAHDPTIACCRCVENGQIVWTEKERV